MDDDDDEENQTTSVHIVSHLIVANFEFTAAKCCRTIPPSFNWYPPYGDHDGSLVTISEGDAHSRVQLNSKQIINNKKWVMSIKSGRLIDRFFSFRHETMASFPKLNRHVHQQCPPQ
ncbi:hypothetical protein BLOT_016704 [Blomia tropicalis]|nr:hypothetical protein BLOT_016704 [Blomia tropicalis]